MTTGGNKTGGPESLRILSWIVDIDPDDPYEDWMNGTNGAPLQVVVSKLMQVILGSRGQETYVAARESWAEKEFAEEVKQHLRHTGKIRVEPQGLTAWEDRDGYHDP
jgi:hypothetical protein